MSQQSTGAVQVTSPLVAAADPDAATADAEDGATGELIGQFKARYRNKVSQSGKMMGWRFARAGAMPRLPGRSGPELQLSTMNDAAGGAAPTDFHESDARRGGMGISSSAESHDTDKNPRNLFASRALEESGPSMQRGLSDIIHPTMASLAVQALSSGSKRAALEALRRRSMVSGRIGWEKLDLTYSIPHQYKFSGYLVHRERAVRSSISNACCHARFDGRNRQLMFVYTFWVMSPDKQGVVRARAWSCMALKRGQMTITLDLHGSFQPSADPRSVLLH